MTETRRVDIDSLTRVHWLAVALVLATGAIHLYSGLLEGRLPVALAGVGFVVAIGLFLADVHRPLLYVLGIPFTAVQLPLWYVAKAGEYTTLGYVDKAIQVVLIVLLAWLYWRHRQRSGAETGPAAA